MSTNNKNQELLKEFRKKQICNSCHLKFIEMVDKLEAFLVETIALTEVKERKRVRELIEGMKNKEFETREHGFSKGGVNIGSAHYAQALQDLLNKLG